MGEETRKILVPGLSVTVNVDTRSGRLTFCNAGHEPPVARQPGEAPQRIRHSGGPPLCVLRDYVYERGELELMPGGWLCAVTDGVTEAMNLRSELYGSARMMETLAAAGDDPKATITALRDDVRRFAGAAEQSDDLTLLCVRRNGA